MIMTHYFHENSRGTKRAPRTFSWNQTGTTRILVVSSRRTLTKWRQRQRGGHRVGNAHRLVWMWSHTEWICISISAHMRMVILACTCIFLHWHNLICRCTCAPNTEHQPSSTSDKLANASPQTEHFFGLEMFPCVRFHSELGYGPPGQDNWCTRTQRVPCAFAFRPMVSPMPDPLCKPNPRLGPTHVLSVPEMLRGAGDSLSGQ